MIESLPYDGDETRSPRIIRLHGDLAVAGVDCGPGVGGMTAMNVRVLITGDRRSNFTWQLVDDGKVLKSGREMTEARAVNAGQDALIVYKRKHRWDRRRKASAKSISIDKLISKTDA